MKKNSPGRSGQANSVAQLLTAAFLAYGLGPLVNGVWKGQPWSMALKEAFDGLVYSLLTAGTFGWLWPR